MMEDGKPFIKFTMEYSIYYTDIFNRLDVIKDNGYGSKGSKRLYGGFIIYDLEQQKECFNFLKQAFKYCFGKEHLKYVFIGLTENSCKKVSKNEEDNARKFWEDNKLIFNGFIDYSFSNEQKWEFINNCIDKIARKEIEAIKEERKREEEEGESEEAEESDYERSFKLKTRRDIECEKYLDNICF